MIYFDLFNGDADGICSLHQLRLSEPRQSVLVTGTKRHTKLFAEIKPAAGDEITALDLAFDSNEKYVNKFLKEGVRIRYFDHHLYKKIPTNDLFFPEIDPSLDICTGLIVNRYLKGRYPLWALVAAFGDNLNAVAVPMAQSLGLTSEEISHAAELGELLNYNSYGESVEDLHFHPKDVYLKITPFENPFEFYRNEPMVNFLRDRYRRDLEKAKALKPASRSEAGIVFLLKNQAWCRRIVGAFANYLTQKFPNQAIAVIAPKKDGGSLVGVRTSGEDGSRADVFCSEFPGGGGRRKAGGINDLSAKEIPRFIEKFKQAFGAKMKKMFKP